MKGSRIKEYTQKLLAAVPSWGAERYV